MNLLRPKTGGGASGGLAGANLKNPKTKPNPNPLDFNF
jgi:hypothetical protein